MENVGSFEIVRYHFAMIGGNPKIVIEQIRVNDKDGRYIKFAKLREVLPYLSQYPVTFKRLENK